MPPLGLGDAAPWELAGAAVAISVQPPPRTGSTWSTQGRASLRRNLLGGAQGGSRLDHFTVCTLEPGTILKPNWENAGCGRRPPFQAFAGSELRIAWSRGARASRPIPTAHADVRNFGSLSVRVAVDASDERRSRRGRPLPFTLVLRDAWGAEADVPVPRSHPAVRYPSRGLAVLGEVRVPLASFDGIDLGRVASSSCASTVSRAGGCSSPSSRSSGSDLSLERVTRHRRRPADNEVMTEVTVECLGCGLPRVVRESRLVRSGAGACLRCGYVGWAPSRDLTEADRRNLRELPIAVRVASPRRRSRYRPVQVARRFSTNAHTPLRVVGERVHRHHGLREVVRAPLVELDLPVERLLADRERERAQPRDRVDEVANRVVERLRGDDPVDEPQAARSARPRARPVSRSSSACLRPIVRETATPGVVQNSPVRTPEVPKRASSAATARSHVATSWQPAAVAIPCTRAITGCGARWIAIIISVQASNSSWSRRGRARPSRRGRGRPRTPGRHLDHDRPDVPVGPELAHDRRHLAHQVEREGIPLLRAVERDPGRGRLAAHDHVRKLRHRVVAEDGHVSLLPFGLIPHGR